MPRERPETQKSKLVKVLIEDYQSQTALVYTGSLERSKIGIQSTYKRFRLK